MGWDQHNALSKQIRGQCLDTDQASASLVKDLKQRSLNATLLHLLGIDHKRLTYRYRGRDFRLTDLHGKIVRGILS